MLIGLVEPQRHEALTIPGHCQRRHRDHWQRRQGGRPIGADGFEHRLAAAWELNVQQHQVGARGGQLHQSLFDVGGCAHSVIAASQQIAKQNCAQTVIFDHQDVSPRSRHSFFPELPALP
jgi:hypothetical protein